MTDESLIEAGCRAIAQFIQPLPYDELPPHRKAVTPRAEWGQVDIREIFEAAIKAHTEWLVEQELVVVPRDADDRMVDRAWDCDMNAGHSSGGADFEMREVWQAMIAAAQQSETA